METTETKNTYNDIEFLISELKTTYTVNTRRTAVAEDIIDIGIESN